MHYSGYEVYNIYYEKQSVIRYIIYITKKKGAFKAPNLQRKVQVPWLERCPKSD